MNKITYHIPIIIVTCGVALFIFALWKYTNGYPFIYQNDESFLSYIHAWYMNFTNPFEFSFLTRQEPEKVYTHNPNMPRYFHYLLMKIGILDFTYQLLVISITATIATLQLIYLALYKKIQDIPLVFAAIIFLLTTPQFIFFSHNTYRVFAFLLFALMLFAASNKKRYLLFISTFLLFQYEYAFALFIAATFFTYLILDGIKKNLVLALHMIVGATISGLLFMLQIISHLSFKLLINEIFEVVLPIRSSANRNIIDVFGVFKDILIKQNPFFWNIYIACLVIGVIVWIWGRKNPLLLLDKKIVFSTNLLFSTFIGGIFVTLLLPEYCSDAYGDYRFPFTCFHGFVIFLFVLSITTALAKYILKYNYNFMSGLVIIIMVAAYPIFKEFKSNANYINLKQINRGEYLDVFKAYENKYYISNFWSGHMPHNKPKPLYPELAYGLESIHKAIVEYKERYDIKTGESLFYICVQQASYDCKKMISELHSKWDIANIVDKKDYSIIEFTPEVLSQITRKSLGITEEQWIYIALKFTDFTTFDSAILNLNISDINKVTQNIYDSNTYALNLLHAFRKANNIVAAYAPNFSTIPTNTIKYLQMRHPLTWKPAMLISIAKLNAEISGRALCNKTDIIKSHTVVNQLAEQYSAT